MVYYQHCRMLDASLAATFREYMTNAHNWQLVHSVKDHNSLGLSSTQTVT